LVRACPGRRLSGRERFVQRVAHVLEERVRFATQLSLFFGVRSAILERP
jgi:hypothetical protein